MYNRGVGLSLYRRHSASCKVHKLKLSAHVKRAYMACACPIWMYGRTSTALVPRQSTGTSDLKEAEAMRDALLAENRDDAIHGPRLSGCVKRYVDSRADELGEKTAGQYRLILERLTEFCRVRGVHHTHQLTVDVLEDFKTEGLAGLASTSKATAVAKLRRFLKDAYRRDWITQPLAQKVTSHRAVYEQKEPFTEEEIEAILGEAEKLSGGTHGYAKQPKTFRLLLELMLETGMRVGDAILFDSTSLKKGEALWIYTYVPQKHKRVDRPKTIESYVTPRLKKAIDKCTWLSAERPFTYGSHENPSYLANEVYARMQTIGERCGVKDCRPHRLRDTFAVRMLLRGMPLEDVSRLLGHSSVKVTETYYARWTPARTRRLERLLAQSLMHA